MDFAQAISNRRSAQLRHGVVAQADRLLIAYGAHACEEARRRRLQAGSARAARYWLRVKAEIGRRLEERRDDAAGFEGRGVEPAALAPFDARPASGIFCGSPDDAARRTPAGRPSAADGAADRIPEDRRTVRRRAEADIRAAMKSGDLDGVRRALGALAPGSSARTVPSVMDARSNP